MPANAFIHPEKANIPPIVEPIPAQVPEQQEDGSAINIDEFIVEPQFPDLVAQENLFNLPVGENPSNNDTFIPGYNGATEPEMQGNGRWLPVVENSAGEEPSDIQGASRVIQPLYHAPTQGLQAVESTGENSVHLFRANEPGVEASSRAPYHLAPGQVWMTAGHDQLHAPMA